MDAPTRFEHLRATPWEPTFRWLPDPTTAADLINSWHEDYPQRVVSTAEAINKGYAWISGNDAPTHHQLLELHSELFGDKPFAGRWRDVRVRVGWHRPPPPWEVPDLMWELNQHYKGAVTDMDALERWYKDFETIHPFQDGNGRVGGVIVAVYSHAMNPASGWAAAEQ